MIVSDHGTELTSHAILNRFSENKIDWHYIAPMCRQAICKANLPRGGRPMQNGFVESFNGRMLTPRQPA